MAVTAATGEIPQLATDEHSVRPETALRRRDPWIAIGISLLCPGVGHIYCGQPRKGLTLFLLYLGALPSLAGLAWLHEPAVSSIAFLLLLLFWAVVQAYAAIDAYLVSRDVSSRIPLTTLNRLSVYLLMMGVGLGNSAAMAVLVRAAAFEVFYIPTASMAPTILPGDRIVVNKLVVESVSRGDLVVFRNPGKPQQRWVKRLIGLPGDRVSLRDGLIHLNGELLTQQPLPEEIAPAGSERLGGPLFDEELGGRHYRVARDPLSSRGQMPEITVPPRHVFVLGDNRSKSLDSRDEKVGFVPWGDIVGVVEFIGYPAESWQRFGTAD